MPQPFVILIHPFRCIPLAISVCSTSWTCESAPKAFSRLLHSQGEGCVGGSERGKRNETEDRAKIYRRTLSVASLQQVGKHFSLEPTLLVESSRGGGNKGEQENGSATHNYFFPSVPSPVATNLNT
jgi:hypothetical protein